MERKYDLQGKSLEQVTRECLDVLEGQVLPSFNRAAVALRKAEENYKEAVAKLKSGGKK